MAMNDPHPPPADRNLQQQQHHQQRTPSSSSVAESASASSASTSLFQCGTCKKSYTRLDHLARHVRSHTQEKPYVCPVCSKPFTRADLLKRHVTAHDSAPRAAKKQKRAYSPSRQGRVSQACEACADVHLKCEEQKPCARCRKKNITCQFVPLPYDNRTSSTTDTVDCAANLLALASETPSRAETTDISFLPQPTSVPLPVPDHTVLNGSTFSPPPPQAFSMPPFEDQNEIDQDLKNLPGFLKSILPSFADQIPQEDWGSLGLNGGSASGVWTPRGVVNDFGLNSNLELDDIDINFLGTYNQDIPFDYDPTSQPGSASNTGREASDPARGIAVASEAFKRSSIWRFRPVAKNSSATELRNLSVAQVEEAVASPESRIVPRPRSSIEPLSLVTRDKVLALILGTCRAENVQRTVSSFPSLDLLDILLQYYLTCPRSLASSFIHLPTFDPQQKRPELIGAMIAAGAVAAPDIAFNKLGYAIQEAIRLAIASNWESDNSGVRHIELHQAFVIILHIGLWSGNNRKMEIAESFQLPIVTMLRRSGKFRRSAYPSIIPQYDDTGPELEEKWRAWVASESSKRLVFQLYRHDAQCSMALSVGPILSPAELLLPLPEARDLWLAPDAKTWKEIYLTKYQNTSLVRRPSLVDCMNDLEHLTFPNQPIDQREAPLIFLFGVWSLTWEYKQLYSLQRPQSSLWSSNLLLTSRYQELIRVCQHFRISSPGVLASDYRVALALELILMHLHMSLEDVQLFFGIEGQEEARRVFPLLRDWVKTSSARQAIWHAGQVIRVAKRMPKNELGDWAAVGVYHASLVFWAYGLISEPSTSNLVHSQSGLHTLSFAATPNEMGTPTVSTPVWLDEEETPDTQRFIALERGAPGIKGLSESANRRKDFNNHENNRPTTLENPSAAIGLVIEVLQNNFDATVKTRPPLVENLIQLMSSLRSAAREIGS